LPANSKLMLKLQTVANTLAYYDTERLYKVL